MQRRRLARPDADQGAAAGPDQIFRQRVGELRLLRREREPLRQRRVARRAPGPGRQTAEQRQPEPLHLRGLHPEAVVGVHPGDGEVRLHRVEASQVALRRIALVAPLRHRRQRPRHRREQIGVEREHHARAGEVDPVSYAPPKASCAPSWICCSGIALQVENFARGYVARSRCRSCAEQRRGAGLDQEAQALALLLAERLRIRDRGAEEVAPGARLVLELHHLQALRIVEAEELRLLQRPDRAAAGGMIRIALDLRRPSFVRGDQEAGGAAVDASSRWRSAARCPG